MLIYSVVKFMGNEGDAGSFTIPVQQAHKRGAATELPLRTATEKKRTGKNIYASDLSNSDQKMEAR